MIYYILLIDDSLEVSLKESAHNKSFILLGYTNVSAGGIGCMCVSFGNMTTESWGWCGICS